MFPDRHSRRGFLAGSAGAAVLAGAGMFFVPRRRAVTGRIVGPDRELGHRMRDRAFPEPDRTERKRVVIVGGGIAGLTAAHELERQGIRDFVLLELESQAGGNSVSGENGVSAFPWAAHYLTLPGAEATEVTDLLREFGVIVGDDAQGRPIYREEYLGQDPQERLFLHGRWQEGLVPQLGLSPDERLQIESFQAQMSNLKERRGSDGRAAFVIPVDRSSQDPDLLALDRLSFGDWLTKAGFTAAPLRWYADYCCRDDFGLPADRVSAWAGLHYFAARNAEAANAPNHAVLTWPAGNGWLVERLRQPLGERVRGSGAVFRVEDSSSGVAVDVFDAGVQRSLRIEAERVVLATPQFVTRRLLGGADGAVGGDLPVYGPWMVANLTLDALPAGRGAALAWDNVWYGSRSLGYIVATHQRLDPVPRATVITYYLPLDHADPRTARQEALGKTWEDWREQILADLRIPHPDLPDSLVNLDVRVWGHGMVAPAPGSLGSAARRNAREARGRLHFAHSDLSGISIFEEACTHGVRAAREVAEAFRTA
jgi:NAD(P)-binding Rossmann-like domain